MAGSEPSHALLGRRIRLQGLVARPALNDRSGVVISFDLDKERLGVQLDAVDDKSEAILVKPANVRVGMRTAWDVPSYVDRTFPETDQVLSGSAAQGLAKSLQSLCGNRITIVDVRLLYGQMFTPEVDRWVQDGVASCQGPVPYGEKPRREMLGRGALVFIWVPPEDALAFKAHVIIDGRDTSIAVVWTHIGPYLVPPCYLTAKEQKHVLRAVVYSLMQSAIVERRIYVFLALSEFVRMELLKASELDLCESMLCLQIEAYLALAKTQGDAWTIDATLSCGKLGEYYESRGEFLRAADVYKRAVSHASRKPHMWVPGGPSGLYTWWSYLGLAFKRACQWREAEVVYNSAKLAIAQYPQTAAEASVNSATNYVYSLLIRLYRDSKQFEKMQDAFLCAFGACGAVDTFGFDKQQGDELTSPAAANKASGRAWIMTGNTHQIVEYKTNLFDRRIAPKMNPKAPARNNMGAELALNHLMRDLRLQKPQRGNACASCGAVTRLKACARCEAVGYCSRECQAAHWREHKRLCKSLRGSVKE